MTVSSPSYQHPPSDCIHVRVLVLTNNQDLFSYGHAKNRGMDCIVVDAIRAKDEALRFEIVSRRARNLFAEWPTKEAKRNWTIVLALVVSQYIPNGEHKNIGCWSNSYVAALKD